MESIVKWKTTDICWESIFEKVFWQFSKCASKRMLKLLVSLSFSLCKENGFIESRLRTFSKLPNHAHIGLMINIMIKWWLSPNSYIFLLTVPDLSALYLIKWQSVSRKLNWDAFIGHKFLRGSHTNHIHKHITQFWVNFSQCTTHSK